MYKSNTLNAQNLLDSSYAYKNNTPFDHCIIDNFFTSELAKLLELEFNDYSSPHWLCYDNPLENKKVINDWNKFSPLTYKVLAELNSLPFLRYLHKCLNLELYSDPGLHGGGHHIHGNNGNLNPHLDYSIHPKLNLQRKLNLIVYLSENLSAEHGGYLGLWEHDEKTNQPGRLIKEIEPKFNRAILFDTTQNSWHGMSRPLIVPNEVYRKSLAVYYLCTPPANTDARGRALFAARKGQEIDLDIQSLIQKRANVKTSAQVYRFNLKTPDKVE